MVNLIVTLGKGSLDLYSAKLAKYLDIPKIYTNIYQKNAGTFNISWFSLKAVKVLFSDWLFIRKLNKLKGIIHLSSHHLGRYGNFLRIPFIITVHDLIRYFDLKGKRIYIHKPNTRDRFYMNLDYSGIKKAKKIITVSNHSKKDIIKYLQIPEEKIEVIYLGFDHQIFKPSLQKNIFNFPYLLFVGSEQPRKNFPLLLKAFKKIREEGEFKNLKLIKVSKAGGKEVDFRGETLKLIRELNLNQEVIFTEFVPIEDLVIYYSNAQCFILPSFYEGFGLTVLEAMACGCPVIISDLTSLPEIAGNATLKINPFSLEDLTNAIKLVLTDEKLKEELSKKGIERASQFSWEKTAEKTLRVYQEVEELLFFPE